MSGLNLKMIVMNAAFDTQKERKYVAQKYINTYHQMQNLYFQDHTLLF